MSSIENTYLSLFIWMNIIGPDDIIAGFLEWKFIFMVTADNPQVKNFCCVYKLILIANLLSQFLDLIPWVTSYNAVYQCAAEIIFVFQPGCKSILQLPLLRILKNAPFKIITVIINQFAGQQNKSFQTSLIAFI